MRDADGGDWFPWPSPSQTHPVFMGLKGLFNERPLYLIEVYCLYIIKSQTKGNWACEEHMACLVVMDNGWMNGRVTAGRIYG